MKYITILVSLLTLGYLLQSWELEDITEDEKQTAADFSYSSPKTLSGGLLAIEKRWHENKRLSEVPKVVLPESKSEKDDSQNLFQLGEESFSLVGIFKNMSMPFIILKKEDGEFIKLSKGASLTDNIKLSSMGSDSIVFDVNGSIKKIKLFERKSQ